MADDTVIFSGSVTTTGRSEALRLEKSFFFFRANPGIPANARRVTARVVRSRACAGGRSKISPVDALEPDPLVSAFSRLP